MKQTSRGRSARTYRRSGSRMGPVGRLGVAAAAAGLLFGLSGCGFDVQTLQPYTPSDGVNVTVGNGPDGQPDASTVKVRGLMIITRTPTSGFLSATLVSGAEDQLTGVTGTVLKPDEAPGQALTVDLSGPVRITPNAPVILVDQQAINVTATELPAGQTASLTLNFAKAGSQQVQVPIIDGSIETYRTVQPSAAPSSGSAG